jgi:hypothetical protein
MAVYFMTKKVLRKACGLEGYVADAILRAAGFAPITF